MLRQCIKYGIDLILIDDEFSFQYKQALHKAQMQEDYEELLDIFKQCQKRLDTKLSFLKETLDYLQKYPLDEIDETIE